MVAAAASRSVGIIAAGTGVHRYNEIDTIQRCTPNLITMHPLTNSLKSQHFFIYKCTPFPGNKKSRPKSRFPTILYPSFLLTLTDKPVSLAWPQIPIFAQKPFDGFFLNICIEQGCCRPRYIHFWGGL